jgi:D-alanyl-D-alanine carboxypeptidase
MSRMHSDDDTLHAGDDTSVSRRTLLRSAAGAGLMLGGLAGASLPAAASAAAGASAATARGGFPRRRLISAFEITVTALQVPGSVLIVRTPRERLQRVYGTGKLGEPQPLSIDSRFRVGSVTKTFTGTVILQLAQSGLLALDDPVSRFRPDVPNGDRITIENLLEMRSGLYNYTLLRSLNRTMDLHPRQAIDVEHLLELAFRARPNPIPNREFEYSNTNTVLLGQIAQQIDGRPLPALFRERLFARVGMADTFMPAPQVAGLPTPHPQGYMYGTNVSTLKTERLPPAQLRRAKLGTLKPNDVTISNPSWGGAAGAGISTARDMAVWAKALCDGSLLNRVWQRKRLDSIRAANPKENGTAGYGLGIARFGALYGHTGEIPGFQSFVGYDPKRRQTVVVLCNLKAAPDGSPPSTEVAKNLIGMLYG